jgi:hypothetical protein
VSTWLDHHLLETTAACLVLVGALLAMVTRRAWLFLLPVPAFLAVLAWYAWEFSAEALPYAVFICVAGYAGIAVGGLLRGRA